ncbi:recombination-associated protein RdgC [Ottowia sp.]|uniref:recombination-associated protein RdgC n=1 Tax=Ottowia sp. TaxID=1898956 RepID=UPI0025FC9311|nr:recombination-associated protein RdgC [Ottowia sp.]MBK6616146.1 recombination-associated protein RdgC [Ottowia sp.]
MFKSLTIYKVDPSWNISLDRAEEQAGKARFVECGPTQRMSMGWSEPRGEEHGRLVESVGGQWIMKCTIDKKILPASVIKKKLAERVKKIEADTGRKPHKKELKDLKEEVILDLLPKAFSKQESVAVWIDPKKKLVVLDVGSQSKGDDIGSLLAATFEGFGLTLIQTQTSAATSMAEWLRERVCPTGFSIDRDCELKTTDEAKSAVKYSHHGLDIEEVREHLKSGKVPTCLAMTWDDRVSFVLTDAMAIKKLAFLEVVFEKAKGDEDPFDANAAIATGELSKLIPDLIEALGGELAEA